MAPLAPTCSRSTHTVVSPRTSPTANMGTSGAEMGGAVGGVGGRVRVGGDRVAPPLGTERVGEPEYEVAPAGAGVRDPIALLELE